MGGMERDLGRIGMGESGKMAGRVGLVRLAASLQANWRDSLVLRRWRGSSLASMWRLGEGEVRYAPRQSLRAWLEIVSRV